VEIWKTLRELAGLSQAEVAHRARVNQSHFSQIERGRVQPGPSTVAKLLSVLPPPPALQATAIQEALESGPSADERADAETVAAALTKSWPDWVVATIRALYWGIPPVGTISVSAQPGLVWLVLVGTREKLLNHTLRTQATLDPAPLELLADTWRALLRSLAESHPATALQSEGLARLVDVAALHQSVADLTWEALRSEWERVPMRQQAILATLIRELAVSP
jgi:transcriptional regulator with XRE-family HTH domain